MRERERGGGGLLISLSRRRVRLLGRLNKKKRSKPTTLASSALGASHTMRRALCGRTSDAPEPLLPNGPWETESVRVSASDDAPPIVPPDDLMRARSRSHCSGFTVEARTWERGACRRRRFPRRPTLLLRCTAVRSSGRVDADRLTRFR